MSANKNIVQYHDARLRTAHDIRTLRVCATCCGLGNAPHMLKYQGALHHGKCLIEYAPWSDVRELPSRELEKVRLCDGPPEIIRAIMNVLAARKEG